MQKINFQNLPSTSTPVNATNLNAIQTTETLTPTNNDLNNALQIAQYSFDNSTSNAPHEEDASYDEYGIVVVIANDENTSFNYRWVFQIALGTNGGAYLRRNINNVGWTAWRPI